MTESINITWPFDQQVEFGRALLSQGAINADHFELAIRYAETSGTSIGHALIHTGTLTQKEFMMLLERWQTSEPS